KSKMISFLDNIDIPQVDTQAKDSLEEAIKLQEIIDSIHKMQNDTEASRKMQEMGILSLLPTLLNPQSSWTPKVANIIAEMAKNGKFLLPNGAGNASCCLPVLLSYVPNVDVNCECFICGRQIWQKIGKYIHHLLKYVGTFSFMR
uniref:Uncharacterized protein n=1 Tax=Xiphophorus couchianus TaxID=32473 RepID=A0A3B5LSC8_9TELE